MEDPVTALETLGSETARALDLIAAERAAAIERARHGFLHGSEPNVAPRPRWNVALALVTAAMLVLFFGVLRKKPLLSFQVDAHAGRTNDQIAALARPVVLAFSDGTALTLSPATRAHVVSLAEHGASIALENGSLDASVIHTGTSSWLMSAGPFSVRVTGTKFALAWDPGQQRFSIRVSDGGVVVSGSLAGSECPVRAGQTLVVSLSDHRLQLGNSEQSPNEQAMPENAAGLPAAAPPASSAASVVPSTPGDLQPPSVRSAALNPAGGSSWRTLAVQGKLREAYASADATGFERACDSASAAELLLLGDGARLSGRPDRVDDALLQLRQRFPNDPRRAVAAFMLGKVSFDRGGADRVAANWFATSLREQPKGALAREAAGRLIEALQRAGDRSGAQRAAKDYLSWYPDGPHAALARSLLH
jgi:TolA-binding protein